MQRQDQRGVLGDLQALRIDVDAALPEAVDLADEMPGIEDDAVADDAELAGAHDARRQKRQLVGLVADDERVAGIVAALEAHDDVGALAEPVDDLALALVAPLGAHHHHICHLRLASAPPLPRRPSPIAGARRAQQRFPLRAVTACLGSRAEHAVLQAPGGCPRAQASTVVRGSRSSAEAVRDLLGKAMRAGPGSRCARPRIPR